MSRVVFIFSILLALSSNSYAGLIQYDWKATGDSSIIFDTQTKLEWLSLNETVGESYNYIESQLGGPGEYNGFRLATLNEVRALIENAGSSWGTCYDCPAEIAPMENLIELIGSDYSYGWGISTWGYIESNPASKFFNGVLLVVDFNANMKYAQTSGGFKNQNSYDNLGGFLVRNAEVPEPSTLCLLLFSLIGVATLRASNRK